MRHAKRIFILQIYNDGHLPHTPTGWHDWGMDYDTPEEALEYLEYAKSEWKIPVRKRVVKRVIWEEVIGGEGAV